MNGLANKFRRHHIIDLSKGLLRNSNMIVHEHTQIWSSNDVMQDLIKWFTYGTHQHTCTSIYE